MGLAFLVLVNFLLTGISAFSQETPSEGERSLIFDTDEGTRMNVDISADGKTIVFDLLGDLYSISATGGKATRLTSGLSFDSKPILSPDGKMIAYVSDKSGAIHMWVMNADGSQDRQLDHGTFDLSVNRIREFTPCWSPDGKYVAFINDFFALSNDNLVMPEKLRGAGNLQFSSNEKYIYNSELLQYNTKTGESEKLPRPSVPFSNPVISSDGHYLAYMTPPSLTHIQSSLRLLDLRTGTDRLLCDSVEMNRSIREHYTFTHDNEKMIVAFSGKIHSITVEDGKDSIIPFLAHINLQLGALNYNTYKIQNDSVVIHSFRSMQKTPDNREIIFETLHQIYRMSMTDRKPQRLVNMEDDQFDPALSPDGKWVVFSSWRDGKGGFLWRIPATGGKAVQLTTVPARYRFPAWSRDGHSIAFIEGPVVSIPDYSNIYINKLMLLDLRSGEIKKLVDSIMICKSPSFSGDGKRIFFSKRADTLLSIGLMKADIRQEFCADPYESFFLNDLSLSLDGKYFVYSMKEDIYLAATPPMFGPVSITGKNKLPVIRVTKNGGVDPHWENDGKRLAWCYANNYFSIDPEKVFSGEVIPEDTIHVALTVPGHRAEGTLFLHDVRVITMHQDQVLEHADIIVKDGRIADVGQHLPVPRHSKIINLRGKTVMPGLIDLHDHLHPTRACNYNFHQNWECLANLAYGVTTARDPSSDMESFEDGEMLAAGKVLGPRLFTVGQAVNGGAETIHCLEDARQIVRKRAAFGGVLIKQYQQPTRIQRQWLLMASREYGLNMTNEGGADMQSNLCMMMDGSTGVEHYYDWAGNIYKDVISLFSGSGIWITPTLDISENGYYADSLVGAARYLYGKYPLSLQDAKQSRFFSKEYITNRIRAGYIPKHGEKPYYLELAKSMAFFKKNGIRIGLGAHGECVGLGTHYELWSLQQGGLTNSEALQEATISGAEALGMSGDLGSIERGKIADLIVLDKNPLDNIENTLPIKYVMKDGELYDGNTLDSIWPVAKKFAGTSNK